MKTLISAMLLIATTSSFAAHLRCMSPEVARGEPFSEEMPSVLLSVDTELNEMLYLDLTTPNNKMLKFPLSFVMYDEASGRIVGANALKDAEQLFLILDDKETAFGYEAELVYLIAGKLISEDKLICR